MIRLNYSVKKIESKTWVFAWLAVVIVVSLSLGFGDNRVRKREKEWDRKLLSCTAGLMKAGLIVLTWSLPDS
jgi:hypothetical protein